MTESARPLPTRIEGIDAAWMTRALRTRAPGVTCRRVEIVDINAGTCTKIRLRLDMDEAGQAAGIPELVMLKGGFEAHSRRMYPIHEAEAVGYRDIFPVLPLPTPRCFFADCEEETLQGIVIMEDLVRRGVEFCSALRPQSFDQVARRLRALGRYHASSWNGAILAADGRFGDLRETEVSLRGYMEQYLGRPDEWQRFVDLPRGAATSVRFHDRERMIAAFDTLVAYARTLPLCLIHGDTHMGNLYIDPDGTPGFFDSLPGRAPGMKEISYHLTCALDAADRRDWAQALVQIYLDTLREHGADAPSFEQAWEQYVAFLLDGYIIFLVNESFYQPEAVNTAYTARFSSAMTDYDTLGLLDAIGRRLS